jgi:peroxiredoxin-like protein
LRANVSHRSFNYKSELSWKGGRRGIASITGKPDVPVSSPAEFKGEADRWSPEDMLVSAANICLLMTFLAYSQRQELEPVEYQSSAEGTLEITEGKYRFTSLVIRPRLILSNTEDAEIARMVLEDAHRDCIITNSLKAAVRVEPEISVLAAT